MRGNVLYTVIPCYNEEEALPETARQLGEKYAALISSGAISGKSRIASLCASIANSSWRQEKQPKAS